MQLNFLHIRGMSSHLLPAAADSSISTGGCSAQNSCLTLPRAALESRAEAGDAVTQYDLAVEHLRSNPAAPDYNLAIKWLSASAAPGNVDAEFPLGYLCEHGEGIERDDAKAAGNYQAAAGKGHAAAANNLASLYHHGMGVPKDLRKALELYLAAAQAGDAVGQRNLTLMYYRGDGTARDYALAAKWFRAAAEQGDAHAQHNLGFLYYQGLGVRTDYTESACWERLAAEHGDPRAQADLGYLYESGRGVPLDYVAGYTWYSRAIGGDKTGVRAMQKPRSHHDQEATRRGQRGPQGGLLQASTAFHTRHGRPRAAQKPLISRLIRAGSPVLRAAERRASHCPSLDARRQVPEACARATPRAPGPDSSCS